MSMDPQDALEFNRVSEHNDTLTDENKMLGQIIINAWRELQEIQTLLRYEIRIAHAEEDISRQVSMENVHDRVIRVMGKLSDA